MNNRRVLYNPAVAYAALLLFMWVLSWGMNAVNLLCGSEAPVASLVSAEGLRWAVRGALETIGDVPWAAVMLFVTSVGLLVGCGMVRSARAAVRGGSLSFVERRAWLSAVVAFLLYLLLLFLCTVSPWNLLSGVTGNFFVSPLMQGWVILSFIGVLFVTSVYGFVYGNYRSAVDVACSVGDAFSLFAPAFVALLPAAGIMPCADYSGLLAVLDVTPQAAAVAADIIYSFPFIYTLYIYNGVWKKKW